MLTARPKNSSYRITPSPSTSTSSRIDSISFSVSSTPPPRFWIYSRLFLNLEQFFLGFVLPERWSPAPVLWHTLHLFYQSSEKHLPPRTPGFWNKCCQAQPQPQLHFHNLFMTCSWHIHDMLMTCLWGVHNLFMTCAWLVHVLFMTCSWLVHDLFMTCS